MNIKEFTESAIAVYLERGGRVHPDITLDIFKLIESNENLLSVYNALKNNYSAVNPTIGKSIRRHFELENDESIDVVDQCSLIKNYKRFRRKS